MEATTDKDSRDSSALDSYLDSGKAEGLSSWQARIRLKKPLLAMADSPQKAYEIKEKQIYEQCTELKAACDWENMIGLITRYISIFPPTPSLYIKRGEAFLHVCDFQSAVLNFQKVLFHDPDNTKAKDFYIQTRYIQAQSFYEQRLFLEALQMLEDVVEMYADCPLTYHASRLSCLAQLDRYSDCLALATSLIESTPDNADLYVARARLHLKFHDMNSCYYDLQSALQIEPEHTEAYRHLRQLQAKALDCKNQAVEQSLYHRWGEALQKISLAIERDPSVPGYHIFRGSLHRLAGNYSAAVDDFLVALGKCGLNEEDEAHCEATRQLVLTYNELAVDCFHKGYYNESVVLLNKAIKEDKTKKGLYCNRGDCFFKMGELAFALADYQQALELCPTDWSLRGRVATVHCHIGVARYENRDYRESVEHFTAAIKCNPGLARPYACRAQAYFLMKKHTEAKHNVMAALYLDKKEETALSLASRLFPGRSVEQVLNWPLAEQISAHVVQSLSTCRTISQTSSHSSNPNSLPHYRLHARQQSDVDYLLGTLKLGHDVIPGEGISPHDNRPTELDLATSNLAPVPSRLSLATSPRKDTATRSVSFLPCTPAPKDHSAAESCHGAELDKERLKDHVIVPLPDHVMPSFKACLREEEFHALIYYKKKHSTSEVHRLLHHRPPLKQASFHLKAL